MSDNIPSSNLGVIANFGTVLREWRDKRYGHFFGKDYHDCECAVIDDLCIECEPIFKPHDPSHCQSVHHICICEHYKHIASCRAIHLHYCSCLDCVYHGLHDGQLTNCKAEDVHECICKLDPNLCRAPANKHDRICNTFGPTVYMDGRTSITNAPDKCRHCHSGRLTKKAI